MKTLLWLIALLPLVVRADPDPIFGQEPIPFKMEEPSWVTSIRVDKPYELEFLMSMVVLDKEDVEKQRLENGRQSSTGHEITPEMIENGRLFRLATAATDSGILETSDGYIIAYQIARDRTSFRLNAFFQVQDDQGALSSPTNLVLNSFDWVFFAGFASEGDEGIFRERICAVRITPAK
ncbi:hypothetical protein [Cerasicoccus arenae]|nr:hypothetical protein [Cerasicoccus arenae]MBK1859476.1 hypothetical protein [Cerasicoccus arenae]